jgi:eukaryotic-like serine/threonine-protein kinase
VPITKYCDDNLLTPRERLELFVPVCQAIQHAHQKGIIHRDVKPSNVMITLYDGKPVAKVIDFGVAKATEQRLTERTLFTQYGTMVGTLEYMSPEQAEMSALGVDTRSDIYSLGVLLYELLTGSTPLTHKRMKEAAYAEILRMIKEEEPPRPSTRLSDSGEALASISAQRHMEPAKLTRLVKGELDWIVMKTLEKDRNRRYETANAFAMDVQRYLNDEAVQACPPSAGYRFRKLARRNKVALTTAALVATALLLGTAVSIWQAVRAHAERDRAVVAEAKTKTEKENTQAALDFLWQDVLLQASPFNEPDRDLKLRTLLDRVADRLERGSGQPPLVEAAVRRMVGALYSDLGDDAKGQSHLERALDVQVREQGEEDPQALATRHALGVCLIRRHLYAEAAPVLSHTLELRRRVLGDEHNDTLRTMAESGRCNEALGRFDVAERLLREVVATRSRVSGEGDTKTLFAAYQLGTFLAEDGRVDEAEALQARYVEHLRKVFGADHGRTVLTGMELARTYLKRDEAARAEALAVPALKARRLRLGPQHPSTRLAMGVLAYAYHLQDKHTEAAELIDDLLAEPRMDAETGRPRSNVVSALELRGNDLIRQGKYAEAEQTLRECLKLIEKNSSYVRRFAFRNDVLLGASMLGQKKYAEAEPLLVHGYEGRKKRAEARAAGYTPLDRRYQIEALGWLVQLYEERGKPDEAAKWRKELEEKKTAAIPGAGR